MVDTIISDAVRAKRWDIRYHAEYVRANRYKRYMDAGQNAIFQTQEDLTKQRGDAITISLVGALDASGGPNNGSTDLVGNEKALPTDGHRVQVGVVRDATVVNMEEEQASAIDIRNAGRTALRDLQMRYLRADIDTALHSINGLAYGSATEANKDEWLDANLDRVLFGSQVSNVSQAAPAGGATNDHSASLANVDSTSGLLTGEIVSLAKRRAQTASNVNGDGIRPYKYGDDMETFVMFVPSLAFRDLRKWMVANGYYQEAMERGKGNPLFTQGSSIPWDDVIVREMPNLGVLPGVGNGGIDVAPCFLCGAQSLAVAWAKRTKTTIRKEDDYGFKYGVGFMEMRGVDKIQYGQGTPAAKDWAVSTVYVSAVADA